MFKTTHTHSNLTYMLDQNSSCLVPSNEHWKHPPDHSPYWLEFTPLAHKCSLFLTLAHSHEHVTGLTPPALKARVWHGAPCRPMAQFQGYKRLCDSIISWTDHCCRVSLKREHRSCCGLLLSENSLQSLTIWRRWCSQGKVPPYQIQRACSQANQKEGRLYHTGCHAKAKRWI